jgi:hypothetical protein
VVAFIAAIAAGVLLPLMNLVFGKFVTTFIGFAAGSTAADEYRAEINKYTCVLPVCDTNNVRLTARDKSIFCISVYCQVCDGLCTFSTCLLLHQLVTLSKLNARLCKMETIQLQDLYTG